MTRFYLFTLFSLLFIHCGGREGAERTAISSLRKIANPSDAQIQELRQANAEIIVRQPDYIIIRTTKMTTPLAFTASPVAEQDLVQRLVHVHIPDSAALQTVINSGVDFWGVEGDTAVARAYDLYIDDLRAAGLTVRIVAQDASDWLEGKI
ncbi:hypothetical protein JXA02_08110 [candidate division KSB1 bacterium]|nr:hypothetical protein [candidate division KSB1 bacterium]RQW05795.1 MAG: hypothetical protein EH222_09555 [candidate division KSB1 bacterium]